MQIKTKHAAIDLTSGHPLKLIFAFALPLLAGQLLQQVYSLTDTMIAGQVLGANALAAIGTTGSLYNFVIGLLIGLSNGCGIVIGRLFGARDTDSLRKATFVMVVMNLLTALIIALISLCFFRPILNWLNTPEAVFAQASYYMLVLFGCAPASAIYNLCAGYMRALGNSRVPLYFLMFSCTLNIGLDYLMMAVLHMGVTGASLATVIAQAASAFFSIRYIMRHFREYLPTRCDLRPPRKIVAQMLSSGFSMAMMASVVNIGSVIMTSSVNRLGEAVIAADTAARRLNNLMTAPMVNLGMAGAAFSSQNMGAQLYPRVRRGVRMIMLLCAGCCTIVSLIIFAAGESMVRLVVGNAGAEVIYFCVMNLRASAMLYLPLGILLCIRQVMQTLGMHIMPVLSSSIELGMKIFCAILIVPVYGYNGAVWSEPVIWIVCCLFLVIMYLIRRQSVYPDLREAAGKQHT